MTILKIALAASVAAAFHALALCIATRLMVEIRVPYRQSIKIVTIEYVAIAVVAGILTYAGIGGQKVAIVVCSLTYLATGGWCVGNWIRFPEGDRLGVGNGVLIQALQIPLIIPVLIVGSFLI